MIVTVIDARWGDGWMGSAAGPATAWFTSGEVYMTSARSMVDNVLAKVGLRGIDRLNIFDHGNAHGIQLGSDWITVHTLHAYRETLSRLYLKFGFKSEVCLYNCHAGQNKRLMKELAGLFGCRVVAGTGLTLGPLRMNFGVWRTCSDVHCYDPPPREFHDLGR